MERTGVCKRCGIMTGSQNGQHSTDIGTLCDACNLENNTRCSEKLGNGERCLKDNSHAGQCNYSTNIRLDCAEKMTTVKKLEELAQDWSVELKTDGMGLVLEINSYDWGGKTFTYKGKSLDAIVDRAHAGEGK